MRTLLALALLVSLEAGATRDKPGRLVVHSEARFKMTAPGGWSEVLLGPSDLGPGAAGAVFKSSPTARGGEEPSITVIYYAPGNPHFKDAADYLARQTEPLPVTPAGEETGAVRPAKLGLLQGKSLLRSRPVSGPPEAVKRRVKLQALLTVADGPEGFYVMTCAAPSPRWKNVQPLFDAALKSFMALPPKKPSRP